MASQGTSDFPIVLVKNLPYNTSGDTLYDLFDKFGEVYQIRVPDEQSNEGQPGTCFIVYQDMSSADDAVRGLNGLNFQGRYIVASLYRVNKANIHAEDLSARHSHLKKLKTEHGIK